MSGCRENDYDVIVAGGGLSGIAAAVAAAREGADVLVIERYGFLGGMATAGLVNPFMSYWLTEGNWGADRRREKRVNTGIFGSIIDTLNEMGGLRGNETTFNEELLKLILDRLVKKYNIRLLLHSYVTDVKRDNGKIKSVTAANKSGKKEYAAKYFVDATGDADLTYLAGCEYKLGRDEDGLCQPMTLCFRVANVDMERFNLSDKDIRELAQKKYSELQDNGAIKNQRENILMFEHAVDNVIHFNSTRITGKNPTDTDDLTQAELEAREQVYELYRFMKENVPGFEKSVLLMSAPQIGIRESRRIVGDYTITADDLLNVVKFEDSVARGTYPVDIHNPSGKGTVIRFVPKGEYYTIPYRAMLPKGVDNLAVAGRPLSSTHEAHSAFRVMPICTCIGEGAGSAVALALAEGRKLREIKPEELHRMLDKYEALY